MGIEVYFEAPVELHPTRMNDSPPHLNLLLRILGQRNWDALCGTHVIGLVVSIKSNIMRNIIRRPLIGLDCTFAVLHLLMPYGLRPVSILIYIAGRKANSA